MNTRQTISEDQRIALNEILELLGLEQASELHIDDQIALCHRFHSFPHASRTNVKAIGKQLDLAELCLQALSRSEVKATIAKSKVLQSKLEDIYTTVEVLLLGAYQ